MLMSLYAARGAPELKPLALETLGLVSTDTIAADYARGDPPIHPDTPGAAAWYKLGVALTAKHQHADAAQAYRAALALDSANADAWNNLGWSLAKLGFYEDAVPALRSAVRYRPADALAANNLAWAAGELSTAEFKRGFALQQTGHPAESAEVYRGLLAKFSAWVNDCYNLGHALMALGRYAEASAEFRRTLELKPDLTAAHLHLATCLAKLGGAAEAKRELERYRRASPAGPISQETPALQR